MVYEADLIVVGEAALLMFFGLNVAVVACVFIVTKEVYPRAANLREILLSFGTF